MPQGWKYRVDILTILNHRKLVQKDKAARIVKLLGALPPFESAEHQTVLTDVLKAADSTRSRFEEAVEVLYNFCDYHHIWLA